MDLHGFSPRLIADLTGVSLKTAQRWKLAGHAPPIASQLTDVLWTPENYQITPGDPRAIPYRAQQLRDLQHEITRPRQFVLL
jgi:hypothetical protein